MLLALLPVFGSLGGAADQAMVADLVPPERARGRVSAVRVAANLGVTIGPPLGGLLLIGGDWRAPVDRRPAAGGARLWRSRGATSRAAARTRPTGPPQRGSFRVIVRDHPFLLFMLSSVLRDDDLRRDRDAAADLGHDDAPPGAGGVGVS